MLKVNEILLRQITTWEWGKSDCITALDVWTESLTPGRLPLFLVEDAHRLDHLKAMARFNRVYQGAAGAYCDAIALSKGYALCPIDTLVLPGDLIILKGPVGSMSQETSVDTIGFVDECCRTVVRTALGFSLVERHEGIVAHYRPRKPESISED